MNLWLIEIELRRRESWGLICWHVVYARLAATRTFLVCHDILWQLNMAGLSIQNELEIGHSGSLGLGPGFHATYNACFWCLGNMLLCLETVDVPKMYWLKEHLLVLLGVSSKKKKKVLLGVIVTCLWPTLLGDVVLSNPLDFTIFTSLPFSSKGSNVKDIVCSLSMFSDNICM